MSRRQQVDTSSSDPLDLTIDSLVFGGDGLSRHEGQVVFVPYTNPGEQVRARIVEEGKSFARAELVEVCQPSPHRVVPICSYYRTCGGCHLQQMTYEAQLQSKRGFVVESLQRIGGIEDPPVSPTLASPSQWHYRHQGQFVLSQRKRGAAVGFHTARSHEVVDISRCPICHPALNHVLTAIRRWTSLNPKAIYDSEQRTGWLRGVETRCNHDGKEATVCLLADRFHGREMRSLCEFLRGEASFVVGVGYRLGERRNTKRPSLSEPLWGRMFVESQLGGVNLRFSIDSFCQGNLAQADRLVQAVLDLAQLKPGETMIDLFAGTGLFSLAAARSGVKVYMVENSESAIEDAQHNVAALNQDKTSPPESSPITVMQTSVAKGLEMLRGREVNPEVVLLDPPRAGMDRPALLQLPHLGAARIVYVSCDPTTLARDVQQLVKSGYHLVTVLPVDMFPQTYHVESVALLQSQEPGS